MNMPQSNKQLNGLILAAGIGQRIKPIVTSKPLLPFMGRTLLERAADSLKSFSLKQLAVVVNPKDQQAAAALLPQAKIIIQEKPTGMAGAVKASGTVLEGSTVVVNGDDLIDGKIIEAFKQQIEKTPDQVVLTGIKSKQGYSGGFFDLQGQSLKVVEQPAERNKPSQWFKLVLDYFPDIQAFISKLKDDYEVGLNQLDGKVLVKTEGSFFQLKFPWQILDLMAGLLTGENQIDPTAKILKYSEVINSYLGPGVVIGQNCLVRDSIVEAGTVIGCGSEIARSYIGPKTNCHRNYIGDSVVEGGSNFGAGAVLANYRFDHQPIGATGRTKFGAVIGLGAQVGVNASLMPGATLAANEIAWPKAVKK